MIRSLFYFLILSIFAIPAIAKDSLVYVRNDSPYLLKLSPEYGQGWNVTHGNLVSQNTDLLPTVPTAELARYTRILTARPLQGLVDAMVVYEYYDKNLHKKGECVFAIHTQEHTWDASFVNSHCTGDGLIQLNIEHGGGGGMAEDYFDFILM